MEWILEKLPVLIFVAVFVVQIARAIMNSRRTKTEREAAPQEDYDEQRRVREIQEQIRRRIAERRGESPQTEEAPPVMRPAEPPPIPRAETTQMPDPFGGPLRRVMEEFERRVQPPPVARPTVVETRSAELTRQEDLAEQLRVLEESRMLAQRRAAHLAADRQAESQSETGLQTVMRHHLLEDLRDPQSIRRAILLREVLGTPVGLR